MTVILKFFASYNEDGRRICAATLSVAVADTIGMAKSQHGLGHFHVNVVAAKEVQEIAFDVGKGRAAFDLVAPKCPICPAGIFGMLL